MFQPPLSEFQLALTAQSRFVRRAIYTTTHRVLSGLYRMLDLKVPERSAPILNLF